MRYGISAAEWRIMQVLWPAAGPLTSAQIVAQLVDGRNRSPRTVKTLLQRLVAKGFVEFTVDAADSRVYHYRAKAKEDDCIKTENEDFLSVYYKGDVGSMLARFIGDSELNSQQIDELTALLESKKDKA